MNLEQAKQADLDGILPEDVVKELKNAGAVSFDLGFSLEQNPFYPATECHKAWREGWESQRIRSNTQCQN